MNAPPILQRHPALRWLLPVGIVCVAGFAATGFFRANATSESLPGTSASALIAAVRQAPVSGFSGTVVSRLSLGLPELPSVATGGGDDASLGELLSGSHTMQVWYGGAERQRIALFGATEETDVFRNGRNVWQWSSADGVAVHTVLPADVRREADEPLSAATMTPDALARQALKAIDPTTRVSVDTGHTVADRSAYELVLTPRSDATKVGSVHIAVDGQTKVPLGVQVYPRGSSAASIDVAFTSVDFVRPAKRNFVFTPPPSARVQQSRFGGGGGGAAGDRTAPMVHRYGTDWASVIGLKPTKQALAHYLQPGLLKQLAPVAGAWGKGRLLDSPLLSVLVTDDGRIYAGAVYPAQLYTAAGAK